MKKTFLMAVTLMVGPFFLHAGPVLAASNSIGYGDISVYTDGQLTAELSGQNPVKDGSLLVCKSRCMIKSRGISLVGAGNAQMAVASEEDTFKLYVKEGQVDFIISNNTRRISFHTPDGTYTVAEVVFNAGSQSVVKGSVAVDAKGNTEISVTEGRLVFATLDGMKTVDADNKIVLAFSPIAMAPGAATVGGGVGTGLMASGAMASGVVVASDTFLSSNKKGSNSFSPPGLDGKAPPGLEGKKPRGPHGKLPPGPDGNGPPGHASPSQ